MKKEKIIQDYNIDNYQREIISNYLESLSSVNININLVGSTTLKNFWDRHVLDSLQILDYINKKNPSVLDMGTGAGIPGIFLNILKIKDISLVDSRLKKISFLENFIKDNKLTARAIHGRLEKIRLKKFDYIIARALSPLPKLINYSLFFSKKQSTCIFLKGRNVNKELIDAKKKYLFDYKLFNSKSSGEGYVLIMKNIKKK